MKIYNCKRSTENSMEIYNCKKFTENGWEYLGTVSVPKNTFDEEIIRIAMKKFDNVDSISNFNHIVQ